MRSSLWVKARCVGSAVAAFATLGFANHAVAQPATTAARCDRPPAKAVSVQGTVEVRRVAGGQWEPVKLNDTFCAGDAIRVGEKSRADVSLVVRRATDVPTYVRYGAADLGVAGKDVLLEAGSDGLYQPIDLRIGRCRLVVATRRGFDWAGLVERGARVRVAT